MTEIRFAEGTQGWADVAQLLFAYQRETAVEVGAQEPQHPEDVWLPVRGETVEPSSVLSTYLLAYEGAAPVAGVALMAHDGLSVMLKRCYVRPSWRRRGIATALVRAAEDVASERGVRHLVLDVLSSRVGAIAAWRRMGFVEAEPWGDASMAYFQLRVGDGQPPTWLGLRYGDVVLRGTDARWGSVFGHQAEMLRRALGDRVTAIEHVGSTAVPGLVAKPIVDVAARLSPGTNRSDVVRSLENKGYTFRGDKRRRGGLLFVLEDQPLRRIVHVHVLGHGDDQWERYLAVRDRLRTDADARRAYAALKLDLARRFPSDRAGYTSAKTAFVRDLLHPAT